VSAKRLNDTNQKLRRISHWPNERIVASLIACLSFSPLSPCSFHLSLVYLSFSLSLFLSFSLSLFLPLYQTSFDFAFSFLLKVWHCYISSMSVMESLSILFRCFFIPCFFQRVGPEPIVATVRCVFFCFVVQRVYIAQTEVWSTRVWPFISQKWKAASAAFSLTFKQKQRDPGPRKPERKVSLFCFCNRQKNL